MTPVAAKVDSIVAVASETLPTDLVGETSTLEVLELISDKTKTATKTATKAATKASGTKKAAPKTAAKTSGGKAKTARKTSPAVELSDDAPSLDVAADDLLVVADAVEVEASLDEDGDLEGISDEGKDSRSAKALSSIKVGPKGVYTEDSIRVYLQEIGRIRLLRPDEEIELARKIADLLQLEELATQFETDHGHYPDTKEWAALLEMPLIKFRRRLMLGRRAKEKMVQSNLRLVVFLIREMVS